MDKSESTFLPLTLFFFQSLLLFSDVVESLNSASLSIFFATLSTHMIKSKLINQTIQALEIQIWERDKMLLGLGPLGGADCCGGLVVASCVRCTVLPLLLLHGCSAVVPPPKSSILRSSLFYRKLGFRFFFFFLVVAYKSPIFSLFIIFVSCHNLA